jgi:hypothetical protein
MYMFTRIRLNNVMNVHDVGEIQLKYKGMKSKLNIYYIITLKYLIHINLDRALKIQCIESGGVQPYRNL